MTSVNYASYVVLTYLFLGFARVLITFTRNGDADAVAKAEADIAAAGAYGPQAVKLVKPMMALIYVAVAVFWLPILGFQFWARRSLAAAHVEKEGAKEDGE